jgi:hypothetical protein
MGFKPPAFLVSASHADGLTPLDIELAGEKADALARAGRRTEEALAQLAAARERDNAPIDVLLDAAADAVFALTVQRELCGLRSQADMIRRYSVPRDVMARVGISRKRPES